ncbi:hypothetical protein EQM14_10680 [Caproiciproducens sp. NJN-50]|uniref:DUF6020 family protein n=1 Tax=Acutalibacteraceae TaxID=3082771 RepID=UPI000FFE1FCC|nr:MULTISPECIES: DUF6020 family protein [Acutalibacteraceae]QAT50194.1 hypothetical protein EQM14_10680 [Caproiciproducens sp. NJN-50]
MNWLRHVRSQVWFCVAAGAVLTSAAFSVFGVWYRHWLPWLLAAAGAAACIRYTAGYGDRRTLFCSGAFSAAISAMFLVGSRIMVQPPAFAGIGKNDVFPFAGLCLLVWAAVLSLFRFLALHPFPVAKHPAPADFRSRLASWALWSALLAAAWLPYFLTYYPGLMTGDSFACLVRAAGWAPVNNQQPVLYQLFLRIFYWAGGLLGSINRGVALYSLTQMLLMASVLGYALYWCRRRGCPMPYLWVTALFFGLNPIYGKYAVTMWKDVLFGGAMLLLTLFFADTAEKRGKNLLTRGGMIHFALISFAVAFLRNNGVYVLLFSFVMLAVFCRVRIKRIGPALLAVLAAILVIQGPVYRAAGIPQNRFDESVGVPLQQMARVAAKDGRMSERERTFLNRMMPIEAIKASYNPFTVDPVKFSHKFDYTYLARNKREFFQDWAGMLVKNGKEYAVAHLMLTLGYWHIGTGNWVVAPGITPWGDETYGIVPYNLFGTLTGVSLKPYIENWNDDLEHFAPTGMSNNIGVAVWLTAFLAVYALARRRYGKLAAVAPLAGLWLSTMAAAPTYCEFRYVFSIFLCAPFLLFFILGRSGPGESDS